MSESTTQEVYRERACKSADLSARLYDTERGASCAPVRTGIISNLSQLEQLGKQPRWDGDVISKAARSDLVDLGLVNRWNGMNFVTQAGMAVLDTLGSKIFQP